MSRCAGFPKCIGTKREVYFGNAHHTSGGLVKKDLKENKFGRIVSIKRSKLAAKLYQRVKDLPDWAPKFKKGHKGHTKIA